MNTLEQFFIEKDSAKKTRGHYVSSVRIYEEITGKTLDELLEEADQEELNRIRWKDRKIKQHLVNFRNHLYQTKSEGTTKQYLADIKAIYRHFEIELHDLPAYNSKQIDKTYEKTFSDVLTKEEIIDAYYEATNVVKCIILFASSSGLSKIDMLNLTVGDFIDACNVKNDDLLEQLYSIKHQQKIIPRFIGERQKTAKKYITFCSPEAAHHIVQHLIGRDAKIRKDYENGDSINSCLQGDDRLFDISESHLTVVMAKINNKLKLGKVGKHGKFKCHALRTFHATTLLNIKENGFTQQEIDALQGRSQDKTHRAYFHNDEETLYEKYLDNVDSLMLFETLDSVSKEDYVKLEKEISVKEKKLEEQQRTIDEIIKNQRELEALLGI